MIRVASLSKSFGDVQAVRAVTFTVPDGEITGLLGPNGAGKSTTMRLIAGVLEPDAGQVAVDEIDVWHQRMAAQRRLGVLSDARGLYHRLTAKENIRYYGRLRGLRGNQLEDRIDELVQLLDMTDFANRRTEGFSTGQKVKVAIARALVHRPPNIVLDEPTAGLDVMSTRAMRQVIRRLAEEGLCVLLSSHIMQEVALLCERIVIIDRGIIAAAGEADELRQLTGEDNLEEAFVKIIGSSEGLK